MSLAGMITIAAKINIFKLFCENPEEYVTYLAETITIFINSLVEEENDEDGEA